MGDSSFDLSGKVALVTGASRGIGAAIAQKLAQQGAHVILTSRRQESCDTEAERLRELGLKADAKACHIGDMTQIEGLYAWLDDVHGRIDILVNNAATNPYYGDILDTELAAFEKTVDVNIRGFFYMSVHAGRRMREQGGGVMLNVASVNAVSPGNKQAIYSITKAAIVNMTKAFAKECGVHGIRVNALLPGLTETKFASALHTNPQVLQEWMSNVPLGRIAQPEEMADAALYLVSSASSYATGSCLTVDGGQLI